MFNAIRTKTIRFIHFAKEQPFHVFLIYPIKATAIIGGIYGGHQGFSASRDKHYILNLSITISGIIQGIATGALTGMVWPIGISVAALRAITTPNKKDTINKMFLITDER